MADIFDEINAIIDPSKGGGGEPRNNQAKGVTNEEIAAMISAPSSTSVADGLVRSDEPGVPAHRTPEGQAKLQEKIERGNEINEAQEQLDSTAGAIVMQHAMKTLAEQADLDEPADVEYVLGEIASVVETAGPDAGLNAAWLFVLAQHNIETDEDLEYEDEDELAEEARGIFEVVQQRRLAQKEYDYSQVSQMAAQTEQQMRVEAVQKFYAENPNADELLVELWGSTEAAVQQLQSIPADEIELHLAQVGVVGKARQAAEERAAFGNSLIEASTRTSVAHGLTQFGAHTSPVEYITPQTQLADLGKAAGMPHRGDIDPNVLVARMKKAVSIQGNMGKFAERAIAASEAENKRRHPRR